MTVSTLTRCKRCMEIYFAHDAAVEKNECYVSETSLKRLKNGKSKKKAIVHLAWTDFGEWEREALRWSNPNSPLCGIAEAAAGKKSAEWITVWFVFSCGCGVYSRYAWIDSEGGEVRSEGVADEGRKYTYTTKEPNWNGERSCDHVTSEEKEWQTR